MKMIYANIQAFLFVFQFVIFIVIAENNALYQLITQVWQTERFLFIYNHFGIFCHPFISRIILNVTNPNNKIVGNGS